jgi:GPH family glycoside/pentoside/hexuronide:cation symporter
MTKLLDPLRSKKNRAFFRFCMGDFARAVFNGLITSYLMYIYVPIEGSSIPVLLVYAAITFAVLRGIGAVVDAFIDLWIASLSDRSKNPAGRRTPLMRWALVPWVVSGVLIAFVPVSSPSWINTVWLGLVMVIYFASSSFYLVSFNALSGELVKDPTQRVKVFTIETFFFVLGSAVVSLTPTLKNVFMGLGFSELEGWRFSFLLLAVVGGVFAFIPAFTFKEKEFVDFKPSYTPLLTSFKRTFKYKNYVILSLGYIFMWVAFQFFNTALLYYVTVLLGQSESFSTVLLIVAIIVGVASYPLVNVLAKKVGKKALLVFACSVYVLVYLAIYLHGVITPLIGGMAFALLIGLLIGFPISITNIIPSAAFADIAEVDEIKTGENNMAMFMTARSFVQQLGQSVVLIVVPGVISLGSSEGKATLAGVEDTALIATIAIAVALVFYLFYEEKSTLNYIRDHNFSSGALKPALEEKIKEGKP